jgi:hypothetical protein
VNFDYDELRREAITQSLLGKKVVRRRDMLAENDDPDMGRVVAGNQTSGMVWVSWQWDKDPSRHSYMDLFLIKDEMRLTKDMRWSGKTLGALERFLDQVKVEGGSYDTVLNPDKHEHIAIAVRLPLATKPYDSDKTQLIGDGKVVGEVPSS